MYVKIMYQMRQKGAISIISEKIINHFLFENVNREILENVLSSSECEIKKYKSGECIFLSKKNEKKLGIIDKGEAVVLSEDADRYVILRKLSSGDAFGVSTLFSDQDSFVSNILAKSSCSVMFLSSNAVKELLERDKSFMFNYIQFLSQRIRILNKRISCFTAGSAEKRLFYFLQSLSDERGEISLDVSMTTLCEMLDIGRASLYRAFDKLESQGVIKKNGKNVTVLCENQI